MELKELHERVGKVLKKHEEIVAGYLFGSVSTRKTRERSDIDVGVLLDDNFHPQPLYPVRLAREIKDKCNLKQEVDVRILNHRSPRFLHQVLSNGQLLISQDEKKRIEFETQSICKYLDFKPFYREYDEKRRVRLVG